MQITCYTTFDITNTRVVGSSNYVSFPLLDRNNTIITSLDEWNKARNQQRNWETLTQVMSLRTQLVDISSPKEVISAHFLKRKVWVFTFTVDFADVYKKMNNDIGLLLDDISGVPMLIGLTETKEVCPYIITSGDSANVVFQTDK
jgi:hypothetical protein